MDSVISDVVNNNIDSIISDAVNNKINRCGMTHESDAFHWKSSGVQKSSLNSKWQLYSVEGGRGGVSTTYN